MAEFPQRQGDVGVGGGPLWAEGGGMAPGAWRQEREDASPELQMVKIKRENRSNQVNF